MTISLTHFLVVAAIMFTLGVAAIILNRKNIIVVLMSVELILLSVNINLVAFSAFLGDLTGQVFALVHPDRRGGRRRRSGSPFSSPTIATAARSRSKTST